MKLSERIIKNEEIDSKINPEMPKNMLIELTNKCNHNCVFCANSKMTRKKGSINEKFLERVLKEAFDEGVREVGFYATGEPFISKNLANYIELAKGIGYTYIYLTTNGALATPKRVMEVIKSGLDSIKFSINGGSREMYKKIHGKDDFDLILDNLKFLAEYRKSNRLDFKIYISFIVTKYTNKEKEQFQKKVQDLIDEIMFFDVSNQGGMMFEINQLLTQEGKEFKEKSLPCSLLFNSLHISYEGYLTACCIDFQNYLVVADLNRTRIKEAWNGEVMSELRRKHLNNEIEGVLCYNCIYNKNQHVKPLLKEYATQYNVEQYSKEKDIKIRFDIE